MTDTLQRYPGNNKTVHDRHCGKTHQRQWGHKTKGWGHQERESYPEAKHSVWVCCVVWREDGPGKSTSWGALVRRTGLMTQGPHPRRSGNLEKKSRTKLLPFKKQMLLCWNQNNWLVGEKPTIKTSGPVVTELESILLTSRCLKIWVASLK